MEEKLNNHTIVITGATSGIGLSMAEKVVLLGGNLIGVGRSQERCKAAYENLKGIAPNAKMIYFIADLSIQKEIRSLVKSIKGQLIKWEVNGLDRLVLNAASVPFWQELTPEGFDMQWAVNHISGFLLTHELHDVLSKAPSARIISVSSGSHYHTRLKWDDLQLFRNYNTLLAYKQTKLAQVVFTVEVNRRQNGMGNIKAFAADPGLVKTDIGLKGKFGLMNLAWKLRRCSGVSPDIAADGIMFLLTNPGIQTSNHIYWKNGKAIEPNPYALDLSVGKKLWEISEQMCGLKN